MHHHHPWRHCHPFHGHHAWAGRGHDHHHEESEEGRGGHGGFGIRRPLRFLAHKLELDETQIGQLVRVLDDLKTERAQGDVDNRRVVAGLSDALAEESFNEAKIRDACEMRVRSAARQRDAMVRALGEIHRMLRPEQRQKLSTLIRTGIIVM